AFVEEELHRLERSNASRVQQRRVALLVLGVGVSRRCDQGPQTGQIIAAHGGVDLLALRRRRTRRTLRHETQSDQGQRRGVFRHPIPFAVELKDYRRFPAENARDLTAEAGVNTAGTGRGPSEMPPYPAPTTGRCRAPAYRRQSARAAATIPPGSRSASCRTRTHRADLSSGTNPDPRPGTPRSARRPLRLAGTSGGRERGPGSRRSPCRRACETSARTALAG